MNDEKNVVQDEVKEEEVQVEKVENPKVEEKKVKKPKEKIGATTIIKSIKAGISIFAALVILFVGFYLIIMTSNGVVSTYREGTDDKIAVLHVNGTIESGGVESYNHGMFLGQLQQVFMDNTVKGVVIQMDTPGGGVLESEEIHKLIEDLKKDYPKPYVAYFYSMSASGGYYISTNADKIVANKNTITGSIGVIMSGLNFGELFEKYGIKNDVIKSGEYKDIMSSYRPMTEEEHAILQSLIDENYGYFVDVVSEGRGISREEVLKIADGRVYSAKQAKELNLVDEIGDFDDAIALAEQLANIENATVVEYYQTIPLLSRLLSKFDAKNNIVDINGIKINLESSNYRPMYLLGN